MYIYTFFLSIYCRCHLYGVDPKRGDTCHSGAKTIKNKPPPQHNLSRRPHSDYRRKHAKVGHVPSRPKFAVDAFDGQSWSGTLGMAEINSPDLLLSPPLPRSMPSSHSDVKCSSNLLAPPQHRLADASDMDCRFLSFVPLVRPSSHLDLEEHPHTR